MKSTTSSVARKRLALVAFSSLWLAACGGGGGGGDVVATAPAPTGSSSPASSPSANGPAAPSPGGSAAPSAGGPPAPGAGAPAPQVSPPAAAFAAFDSVVLADNPLRDGAATARLAGGGNVALWVAGGPASPASTVMARLTDSAGHPVGNAFAIKAEVDTVMDVAVAAAPDGGFLVVWAGFDAAFDPTNQSAIIKHLMARRYAADGTLLNETRLIAEPQFVFRGISVEPLPAGGYVVGWTMQVARLAPGWGYLQRLDANGKPAGAQVALVDRHDATTGQADVALVPLADGTLTAAWVERPNIGDGTTWVSTRRFDASMQPLGAPTEVEGTRQPPTSAIRVAAARSGANVALAWAVVGAGQSDEIRSAVLAPGSSTPGAVTSVTTTFPVVTLRAESLGSGTYGVIWQELNGSNIGAYTSVFMQRHDATAAVTGAPVELDQRHVTYVSRISGGVGAGQDIGVDAGPDGHVVVSGQFADSTTSHVVFVGR